MTETILFGVKGKRDRTFQQGNIQENIISSMKKKHSRKLEERYQIIEFCSSGLFFDIFVRRLEKIDFVGVTKMRNIA